MSAVVRPEWSAKKSRPKRKTSSSGLNVRVSGSTTYRKVSNVPHQVESMMSARKTPWHGLGVVLPDYPKSKRELLEASGLDWQVGEFPVFVEAPDGTRIEAEDKKGIVRLTDNALLSVMSGSYQPVQPSTLVDFAYALLEAEEGLREDGQPAILFETAISLAGGKVNT